MGGAGTFHPRSDAAGPSAHRCRARVHLSGKWAYREYPDQPQTAGSYLYEPGSSIHQFYAPEDNTEDTVVLFIVYGANINFTPEGQFHSVLDAITIQKLTAQMAEAQGFGKINYLTGGSARFTEAR